MREQNEYIFSLLAKSLKERGEDYLLKEGDVIEFYQERKVCISERTARDILRRLYPYLDPKTRKERFFARRIISKFILHDIGGTSLEDLLEPYQLELLEKELLKRNIHLEINTLQELLREEFVKTASKWLKSDVAQQVQSVQEKMSDIISEMNRVKSLTLFEGEKPKEHFDYRLSEANFRMSALRENLKGISTYTKVMGIGDLTKKVMSYEGEVIVEKRKLSLNSEEQEYLNTQLSIMQMMSNNWVWDLRHFKGRTFVVKGGRGGAKTYEVSKFFIELALQEKNAIFLCIRETKNAIKDSSLSALKEAVSAYELDRFFCVTNHTLRCRLSGSTFIFRGTYNAENSIKSINNIKYVWVDEAQLIKQQFWTILDPTIRRDDAKIIITYNPNQEDDPVYTTYVKNPSETTKVLSVNLDDNEFRTQALVNLREDHRRNYSPEDFAHIWEGAFLKYPKAQVFYGKFVIEATPVPPPNTQFYYGLDLGEKDPTALVRCWVRDITEEKTWELIVDRCFYASGATFLEVAKGFESVLEGNFEGMVLCDHNEPRTVQQLRSEFGFNIRTATKGSGSIQGGIRRLKSFKRIVIDIDDFLKPIHAEFKTYKYKIDPRTEEVGTVPEDKNNHAIDALRYALSRFKQEHPTTLRKDNSAVWNNLR